MSAIQSAIFTQRGYQHLQLNRMNLLQKWTTCINGMSWRACGDSPRGRMLSPRPIFHWIIKKKYQNLCRQKTSLHRHQICCYANESLFTQAPFCLFFQNIPDTQERDGESEKEGGYATHQKVFADLTSSYIRRELVQIKLRLFIIPQAADHQKAFTFNLPHYHEYS